MGVAAVIVFHLALVLAIQSGLARKFVKVVQGPVEARLLEETKPDIPPPPPPPPKNLPPPPAYVPPVDAPVTNAPVAANAIAAVVREAPLAPAPPPVAMPASPANVRVAPTVNAATNCQKVDYPSASRREEEEGTVHLKILIGVDGRVTDTQLEKSSGFKRLDEATRLAAMTKCQFRPGTLDGKPEAAWGTLRYTWRLE